MKKPTLDEVAEYCDLRHNGINAAHFLDYYDACGWMVGRKAMKDWKAAVRTWENRRKTENKASSHILEQLKDRSWAN